MTALDIAQRLAGIEGPRVLKFGLYKGEGWVTASNAEVIKLLCDVWNHRAEIAEAVTHKGTVI